MRAAGAALQHGWGGCPAVGRRQVPLSRAVADTQALTSYLRSPGVRKSELGGEERREKAVPAVPLGHGTALRRTRSQGTGARTPTQHESCPCSLLPCSNVRLRQGQQTMLGLCHCRDMCRDRSCSPVPEMISLSQMPVGLGHQHPCSPLPHMGPQQSLTNSNSAWSPSGVSLVS